MYILKFAQIDSLSYGLQIFIINITLYFFFLIYCYRCFQTILYFLYYYLCFQTNFFFKLLSIFQTILYFFILLFMFTNKLFFKLISIFPKTISLRLLFKFPNNFNVYFSFNNIDIVLFF